MPPRIRIRERHQRGHHGSERGEHAGPYAKLHHRQHDRRHAAQVADSLWKRVLSAEDQERLPESVTGEALRLFGPLKAALQSGTWEDVGVLVGGNEA